MAGSRIKGITVEIGGNTTKLQSNLKGVNSEIKNTQNQLKKRKQENLNQFCSSSSHSFSFFCNSFLSGKYNLYSFA